MISHKHSMTFDGLFGITVSEYLLYRAMYKTTDLNHRTWQAYTSPKGLDETVRQQPADC